MTLNPAKIRLYSAWFCPYAQRAWIVINNLEINYQLIESLEIDSATHGYKKNSRLLEINQRGLVPTLEVFESEIADETQTVDENKKSPRVVTESIDVMKFLYEYVGRRVEDTEINDANKINETVCSPYYRCLMKQNKDEQIKGWNDLLSGLESFSNNIKDGKYYKNDTPNTVDFTLYPWAFRLYVLEEFRGFKLDYDLPWVKIYVSWRGRMESEVQGVRKTLPDKIQLLKSYERYADASTKSLVGNAVNGGKEAHDI